MTNHKITREYSHRRQKQIHSVHTFVVLFVLFCFDYVAGTTICTGCC